MDYLAQFAELPDIPLTAAPAAKKTQTIDSQHSALPLVSNAARILGEMSHILLRTPASDRRPRLTKQFEDLEEVLIPFIGVIPTIAPEQAPELDARFTDILTAFRNTRHRDKFSKKAQGELADTLEAFTASLKDLALGVEC